MHHHRPAIRYITLTALGNQKGAYVCDSPVEEMHNNMNALFAAERAD